MWMTALMLDKLQQRFYTDRRDETQQNTFVFLSRNALEPIIILYFVRMRQIWRVRCKYVLARNQLGFFSRNTVGLGGMKVYIFVTK